MAAPRIPDQRPLLVVYQTFPSASTATLQHWYDIESLGDLPLSPQEAHRNRFALVPNPSLTKAGIALGTFSASALVTAAALKILSTMGDSIWASLPRQMILYYAPGLLLGAGITVTLITIEAVYYKCCPDRRT